VKPRNSACFVTILVSCFSGVRSAVALQSSHGKLGNAALCSPGAFCLLAPTAPLAWAELASYFISLVVFYVLTGTERG